MAFQPKRPTYKEKLVLLIYLPALGQRIMDTASKKRSECTLFGKGKQVYTRVFGLLPSSRGRPDIYLPKYKQEERVFLIINLLSLIHGLIKHVDVFWKEDNPTQGFLITLAFLSVGDTKSDFSLTEG